MKALSKTKQEKALKLVAAWLGKKGMTADGSPAPTGAEAAYQAMGPQLIPDWDGPYVPTPTILLEGGPYDWAVGASFALVDEFDAIGVYAEPFSGWALCLYGVNS